MASVPPPLMPHRQPVQLVAEELPLGQVPVHALNEPAVVRGLKKMGQLVDDDVLQAFLRLLGQLQIQQDRFGTGIAEPHRVFIFCTRTLRVWHVASSVRHTLYRPLYQSIQSLSAGSEQAQAAARTSADVKAENLGLCPISAE